MRRNMVATSKRIADLERKLAGIPTPSGRTPSQRLAAERYAKLLIKGRPIPKTLQKQIARLPPEEIGPGVQGMIDATMGNGGNGEK